MRVPMAIKAQSVRLLTVLYTPARVVTRPADYTDLMTSGLITTHTALFTTHNIGGQNLCQLQ